MGIGGQAGIEHQVAGKSAVVFFPEFDEGEDRLMDSTGISEDPADRFIAATAIAIGGTLATADQMLLDWQHSLTRLDART